MKDTLVIGSRGSKLALRQADLVRAKILVFAPEVQIQIEIIKTTGDVKNDPLSVIGGKGVFTKELEDALLDKRIDVAVHSLKDLPTFIPEKLTVAAICEREDPRDALVLPIGVDRGSIQSLPEGAVVGTSSQRRSAQLKNLRPDLAIKDLRGNVDTRLRKLDEGQYDALILAAAGLLRLGFEDRIAARISTDEILPAVGQGALAVETRVEDHSTIAIVTRLNHAPTSRCCTTERGFLHALGGGCQLPIAALGSVSENCLTLEGLVASHDGSEVVRDKLIASGADEESLGQKLAHLLWERGASRLLS
ncbi:MAG: hydroxymethylbilane synthase [Pyrinomonadaceae bacterium]